MSEVTKGEWWIQVWNEGTRYESVHINPPLGGNDAHAVATLSGPDAKANARHIVHCVNNHESLVEMVDRLLGAEVYADGEGVFRLIDTDMAGSDDVVMEARTLLAQLQADKGGE